MRTLSAALLTAQQNTLATPHIRVYTNSTNYWSKLLYLEHIEEPYRDYSLIVLENHDRALDSVVFRGGQVDIAYGHYTGNNVAEPDGDNAGNEYSYSPELWVKRKTVVSVEGSSVVELYCEGHWFKLRETKVMGYGDAPYYQWVFNPDGAQDLTIYDLIKEVIENVMGWTLNALATSDGIIDTTYPEFIINVEAPQTAADILYRLISMTKCYLRVGHGHIWDIIYPQEGDEVARTFYSYQVPYFREYQSQTNLLIPNSIAVYCNNPGLEDPWPEGIIVGTAQDTDEIALYDEVLEPYFEPYIVTQGDADNRASAILTRIAAERVAGKLIVPHDAGMELYDNVLAVDTRGT